MPIAILRPTLMEVWSKAKRSYVWVEGYKVVAPSGHSLLPYFRKREAKRFCLDRGWSFEVKLADD